MKKKYFLAIFIIAVTLSFLLYGNTISGEFVMDDYSVIANRPILTDASNFLNILFFPWHKGHCGLESQIGYRPLTLASYTLDFSISSLFASLNQTASFHIINILIHALNSVLVFYLARKIASGKVAVLSAALFMFLPIHVEAVASIVERPELLGTTFSILSLILFFNKKYIFSSAVFLLALLSKEFAIILLPLTALFLLMDRRFIKFQEMVKIWSYYLAPTAIYFLVFRYLALGQYAFKSVSLPNPVVNPLGFVSAKERIFTSFSHIFLYLKKTFYPVDLSPDYSFNSTPIVKNLFSSPEALIGLLFLITVIWLFIFGNRAVKTASVLFLGPVFLITNIFFVATGAMRDKYWYWPSVGLVILIAIGIDKILIKKNLKFLAFGIGIPVLIWYAFLIIKQNKIWMNERVLFGHAVQKSPNSVWARTSLASVYLSEGEFEKARREMELGLKIYDKYPRLLINWGKLQWKDGNLEEAEKTFKKAINFDNSCKGFSGGIYRLLAFLYLEKGDNKKALEAMEKAINSSIPYDDVETVRKGDQQVYESIKRLQSRTPDSYSELEKEELQRSIKAIRGF